MTKYYRKPAINSPLFRVLLFFICWLVFFLFVEVTGFLLMKSIFPNVNETSIPYKTFSRSLSLVASLIVILYFRRKVDRRPFLVDWFSIKRNTYGFLIGFIGGTLLIALGAFILGRVNYIEFFPGQLTSLEFLQYSVLFTIAATTEEVVFRGYILENLLESMHPFLALTISSILFMLLHFQLLSQPDSLPFINLFLAGLFLGASFIYTKNLWFPLGLHISWNLFQGPVFGFEVSGLQTKSFLRQTILVENTWTGGAFGFEGSILATILIVVATIFISTYYNRKYKYENV